MVKRVGRAFLAFATRLGRVQAWLLLSAAYFLVLGPIALVFKMLADPLRLRKQPRSMWRARPQSPNLRGWAKAQS